MEGGLLYLPDESGGFSAPFKLPLTYKPMHRALRRHHYRRLKRKRCHYYSGYGRHRDDVQGMLANTATLCSCSMCGNPRKYFGEKTRQEALATLNFIEQVQLGALETVFLSDS